MDATTGKPNGRVYALTDVAGELYLARGLVWVEEVEECYRIDAGEDSLLLARLVQVGLLVEDGIHTRLECIL